MGPLGRTLGLVLLVGACVHTRDRASQFDVVFVCEHGAAKSILASAYFNAVAAKRASAAGLRATPRGAVPQEALSRVTMAGMAAEGLVADVAAPLPLSPAPATRLIVAFDCELPSMKGVRADECWNDVPQVGEGYGQAREAIRQHVEALLEKLELERRHAP